jgi:hypothetical protein
MILDSVQGLNAIHASLCGFLASKDHAIRLPADVSGSSAPYDELLPALEVEKTEGPIFASILADRTLKIAGSVENLGIYVGFFHFDDADDGAHHHPEHVARPGYIKRGTLSVIIEADNEYFMEAEGEG